MMLAIEMSNLGSIYHRVLLILHGDECLLFICDLFLFCLHHELNADWWMVVLQFTSVEHPLVTLLVKLADADPSLALRLAEVVSPHSMCLRPLM